MLADSAYGLRTIRSILPRYDLLKWRLTCRFLVPSVRFELTLYGF
jgi:hypothetical protein